MVGQDHVCVGIYISIDGDIHDGAGICIVDSFRFEGGKNSTVHLIFLTGESTVCVKR